MILANLLLLLLGFALLAEHFEDTEIPAVLPRWLPDDWKGGFVLLVLVFVLSSFLDNIAAAMIGGTMAHTVFRGKVHIGYLAAIVAASNAGGAGSVVGDTTTTMMWIAGVHPLEVLEAFIASARCAGASSAFRRRGSSSATRRSRSTKAGIRRSTGARRRRGLHPGRGHRGQRGGQHAFQRGVGPVPVYRRRGVAGDPADRRLRRPDWSLLPGAFKGTVFLLSLVLCASMMPVEKLPAASWQTALGLGFLSAVFDNIPLTALALSRTATTGASWPTRSASAAR